MTRPTVEVADLLRTHGDRFVAENRSWQARQRWLACREQELLGLSYFHVVFTLPHELNRLCQRNAALLYNLLFRCVSETLLEVAADPQHLGAEIGFLAILHSWGQNLLLNPHS